MKSLRSFLAIVSIAFVLATQFASGAPAPVWPPAGYTSVRAYIYNLETEPKPDILLNGKLNKSVVNKRGVRLTQKQVETLLHAVTKLQKPDGLSVAPANECIYWPRHAFVFYDAQKQPVGFIEVCFACEDYRVSPSSSDRLTIDYAAVKTLVRSLHLPVFKDVNKYDDWKARHRPADPNNGK